MNVKKVLLAVALIALLAALIFMAREGRAEEYPINPNSQSEEEYSDEALTDSLKEAVKAVKFLSDAKLQGNPQCKFSLKAAGEMSDDKIVFWVTFDACERPGTFRDFLWIAEPHGARWWIAREVEIGNDREFKVRSIAMDGRFVYISGLAYAFGGLSGEPLDSVGINARRTYDAQTGVLK